MLLDFRNKKTIGINLERSRELVSKHSKALTKANEQLGKQDATVKELKSSSKEFKMNLEKTSAAVDKENRTAKAMETYQMTLARLGE